MKKSYFIKIIRLSNLLFLFFLTDVIAQENYLKASLITQSGLEKSGWIDYRNWQTNPQKISFKETLEGDKIEYKAKDIQEFSVDGVNYKSGIVEIEQSNRRIEALDASKELKISIDTVFLETLIGGVVELYSYKDKNTPVNYYIKDDKGYTLLQYKKYMNDMTRRVREYKGYVNQLLIYLNECPSIYSEINNLTYSNASLKNLYKKYYDCIETQPDFQKKSAKIAIKFGITSGVSYTDTDVRINARNNVERYFALDTMKFSQSKNFTFGLFCEFFLPMNQGKWSFYSDLLMTSYSVSGAFEDKLPSIYHKVGEAEIGQRHLKLSHLIKYRFSNTPIALGVGISNSITLENTKNYYLYQDLIFGDPVIIENRKIINNPANREFGVLFSLSTKWRRLGITARYERSGGISDLVGVETPTSRFYLLANFAIN